MDETYHLSNPKNSQNKFFWVTISQNSSTLTQHKQQIAAEHRNNQHGYSKQEHNTNSKLLQNINNNTLTLKQKLIYPISQKLLFCTPCKL